MLIKRKGKVSGYFRIAKSFYVFLMIFNLFFQLDTAFTRWTFLLFNFFYVWLFHWKSWAYDMLIFFVGGGYEWCKIRATKWSWAYVMYPRITTYSLLECYTFFFCSFVHSSALFINWSVLFFVFATKFFDLQCLAQFESEKMNSFSVRIISLIDVGEKERQIYGFPTCFLTVYFSFRPYVFSNFTYKPSKN